MTFAPLALARRHVLGDLYRRCDAIFERVPVYMNSELGERLGFADESMGKYADAIMFHLAEDICKKLSTGHYIYTFGYEKSDPKSDTVGGRIRLTHICLTGRPVAEPAGPRNRKREV